MMLLNKTVYNKLAAKVNNIDTSDFGMYSIDTINTKQTKQN